MKNTRIALLGLLALISASAQTSSYPGSLDTNATLFVAKDNVQTQLNAAMAVGDTVAVVKSNTNWAVNMIATVESEQMLVTAVVGNSLTVTRAFGGTSAAAHAANKTFSNYVNAAYQSSAKSAILAIETALGANLSNVPAAGQLISTTYKFTPQTPGGSLAAGAQTITLNPMPAGINATSVNAHQLYISGGTGTAESVPVIGWSATTVTVTVANSHSGAWTIQSATAGIQEAIRTVTVANGLSAGPSVFVPGGTHTIYGTVTNDNYASITGAGSNSTILLKAFAAGDMLFVGTAASPLAGIGSVISNLQIRILPGITDASGYAIHVNWRYNVTVREVTIYGDPNVGIGQIKNGIKFENALTFSLYNTKILNVKGIGLELASTPPDQVTGRIVGVDVTSGEVTNSLVYMHGNVLSMFIDGLQMQGGLNNWEIDTTGGAFTESTISNIVFDSASGKAFNLHGTGNTFKISMNNLELSTIAGLPNLLGMVFDGTGAGIFTSITVNNVTGGVNASNNVGTAIFILSASNFLLSNSQLQGAGGGVGDTTIQVQGTTNNVIISNNVIGYDYLGGTGASSQAYRAVYVPSGTHAGMTITGNRIYGSSVALSIGGTHTLLNATANTLAGGITTSFGGTGTAYFDNAQDVAGLNGRQNYIATETGANNAIAGTLSGATLAAGLRTTVKLAHTLQAGANTFNLNAGGAVAIKSSRNVANNIATAWAATGTIVLMYDGVEWVDLSQ